MKKETQKAIVRLVVTAVLLTNGYLAARGSNPLPFTETAAGEITSEILALISCIWVWWKNNNVTNAACEGQKTCDAIKKESK